MDQYKKDQGRSGGGSGSGTVRWWFRTRDGQEVQEQDLCESSHGSNSVPQAPGDGAGDETQDGVKVMTNESLAGGRPEQKMVGGRGWDVEEERRVWCVTALLTLC